MHNVTKHQSKYKTTLSLKAKKYICTITYLFQEEGFPY